MLSSPTSLPPFYSSIHHNSCDCGFSESESNYFHGSSLHENMEQSNVDIWTRIYPPAGISLHLKDAFPPPPQINSCHSRWAPPPKQLGLAYQAMPTHTSFPAPPISSFEKMTNIIPASLIPTALKSPRSTRTLTEKANIDVWTQIIRSSANRWVIWVWMRNGVRFRRGLVNVREDEWIDDFGVILCNWDGGSSWISQGRRNGQVIAVRCVKSHQFYSSFNRYAILLDGRGL